MEEKTYSFSEPFTIKVPDLESIKLDNDGLAEIPDDQLYDITVRFLYCDKKVIYNNDDYWTYNDTDNTVYVRVNNSFRIRYIECMKKKLNGAELTREEELIIEDFELIINAVTRKAAEKAAERIKLYQAALSETTTNNDIEQLHIKEEKKEYRTKRKALEKVKEDGNYIIKKLPENLAVITNEQYKGGLSLNQIGGAYLYPLASTDGLKYDGKNLSFRNCPTSAAELQEINKNKEIPIDSIDLPLLRMFYSIILADFESSRKQGVVNETVSVYMSDLAKMMGKNPNTSKKDIQTIINKTASFQNIYGIFKDPKRPNGIGTAVPLLVWLGYDESTNTIKFSSPYMTELIKKIYSVSIRRDKKGIPKLKNNGDPLLTASHSYLVKPSIVKERNKRAAEIVMVVVATIEQAGNNIPHLKASTIIERVPQLQEALNKKTTNSERNKLLKTTFKKAWELLDTQTNLKDKYPTIILPDPSNPINIPKMDNLNKVFEFPHQE